MSTISSSTTTTTAYTVSADTTGTLVIQTGATPTTAVTVNASGALGVGSSPSYGTSGQVLTSAGSSAVPTWTTVSASQWTTSGSNIYYSSGNASIGFSSVSAWALGKGLEIGFAGGGLNATRQAEFNVNCNAYYDGTWRYGGTGKACVIQFSDGTINTLTSTASGSAGGAISWTSGPYVANGGTSWTSSSDERLKNITGQIENALDKVGQLRAVKFTWKSDVSNKAQIGLIAQDVQAVLPEVVNANAYVIGDETEYLGVNYDQVIPLLVASIKELKVIVDAQAVEIAELKGNR
jgi:hypothetical protein